MTQKKRHGMTLRLTHRQYTNLRYLADRTDRSMARTIVDELGLDSAPGAVPLRTDLEAQIELLTEGENRDS